MDPTVFASTPYPAVKLLNVCVSSAAVCHFGWFFLLFFFFQTYSQLWAHLKDGSALSQRIWMCWCSPLYPGSKWGGGACTDNCRKMSSDEHTPWKRLHAIAFLLLYCSSPPGWCFILLLSSAANASSSLHLSVPLPHCPFHLAYTYRLSHNACARIVSICARWKALGSSKENTKISPTPTRFTPKLPRRGTTTTASFR